MKNLRYLMAKTCFKIMGNKKEIMSSYFRRAGMKVGKNCNICCNIMTTEPYMIEIKNNVTISGNVKFVTHDNSVSKLDGVGSDIFGRIVIGNNCFIGQNALILYGVELSDNIIVAAGSVVCNSFTEQRIIIGGNPARKIGEWAEYSKKAKNYIHTREEVKRIIDEGKNDGLVIRKAK